jgi:Zn-dependent protease
MHGVVAITKIGGDMIDKSGKSSGFLLAALISMNLAILNILPIPALDGGHLMFLIIEKIMGKPVDEKVIEIVSTVFFSLLIILMIVLAVASLVVLLVKGIMAIVMKLRNRKGSASGKVETKLSTAILANLSLAIPPVIAVILYRMFCADQIVLSRPFSVFSAVLAGLVCLSSVANMIYLLRKKRYCTAAVSFYAAFFITFFQFYDFWSC